jgi:hypothetical protein
LTTLPYKRTLRVVRPTGKRGVKAMNIESLIKYIEESGEETDAAFLLEQIDEISDDPKIHRIITAWYAARAYGNEPEDDDNECEGHESLAGEHMGETVYCDGSCR